MGEQSRERMGIGRKAVTLGVQSEVSPYRIFMSTNMDRKTHSLFLSIDAGISVWI